MDVPVQRQVFVYNGLPISFYLLGTNERGGSSSLTQGQREELARRILENGGRVCPREEDADTIIAKEGPAFDALEDKYSSSRKYVEKPTFVNMCIRNRRYTHEPIPQKPMSGRIPGNARNEFTQEDDQHLCEYIAHRIPEKEAGGRYGEKFYKELMDDGWKNPQEYGWARRHTWQSWRERYRKNDVRLDPVIDRIAAAHPPPVDGKGLYPYSRFANDRIQEFIMKNQEPASDEEDGQERAQQRQEEEEEDVVDFEEMDMENAQRYPTPVKPTGRRVDRRRTDVGLRKAPTPPPMKPRRSAPVNRPEYDSDDTEEFRPVDFGDISDDGERPGTLDAGPSGVQRSPSPPTPPELVKKLSAPRPLRPGVAQRAVADQAPMSSQVTLVNLTQPRKVAPQRRQTPPVEDEELISRPSKRPRNMGEPYVLLESPQRRRAQQQRSGLRSPVQQDDDNDGPEQESEDELENEPAFEPQDEPDKEPEDEPEHDMEDELEYVDLPAGARPNEDDVVVVEDMLEGSIENESLSHASLPQSELDSDDERVLRSLNLDRPPLKSKASSAQTGSSRSVSATLKRPLADEQDEDLEAFAETLDLIGAAAPRRASRPVALGASASTSVSRSLVQASVTPPSGSRGPIRAPSVAESVSSSDSRPQDPLNRVPLDGTRASAQKKRTRRGEEPYSPPRGTKAFEAVAQVSAKRTRSGKIRV